MSVIITVFISLLAIVLNSGILMHTVSRVFYRLLSHGALDRMRVKLKFRTLLTSRECFRLLPKILKAGDEI